MLLNPVVQDDGVGKVESAAMKKNSTSFGTQLIDMLSKKLDGNVQQLDLAEGYGTSIFFINIK